MNNPRVVGGRADGPRRVDSEQDYILDGNPGRYCEEGAGARILVAHRLGSDLSRVGLATGVYFARLPSCQLI